MKAVFQASHVKAAIEVLNNVEGKHLIKFCCEKGVYKVTALSSYLIAEFSEQKKDDNIECGECVVDSDDLKKIVHVSDKLVGIEYKVGQECVEVEVYDKNLESTTYSRTERSCGYPVQENVDKILNGYETDDFEKVSFNASYLGNMMKGVERAFGKNVVLELSAAKETQPMVFTIDGYFRGALMPVKR